MKTGVMLCLTRINYILKFIFDQIDAALVSIIDFFNELFYLIILVVHVSLPF